MASEAKGRGFDPRQPHQSLLLKKAKTYISSLHPFRQWSYLAIGAILTNARCLGFENPMARLWPTYGPFPISL